MEGATALPAIASTVVIEGNGATIERWDSPHPHPVVGDRYGDGIDTVGVKQGVNWSLRNSSSDGTADITFGYGLANDLPLVAMRPDICS